MRLTAEPTPLLSPHRALVVPCHAETDVVGGRLVGHVEPVVSGQAPTFQTLEGLRACIALGSHARGMTGIMSVADTGACLRWSWPCCGGS